MISAVTASIGLIAIDAMNDAALLEEREERRRLLIVEAQPLFRRLARVVRPATAEDALDQAPGRGASM